MTDDKHQMWTDKYRPTSFNQLQGNNTAIDRLKDWAKNFPEDRTPRLLEGIQGVGKTTAVEVIADWLDLQLVEMNASSLRSSDDIEEMAGLIRNQPVGGTHRVVLLDEADSWHHATNKQPLYDALDNPQNIVFLAVNDKWETPNAIVRRCEVEEFKLGKRSIGAKIKDVAESEGIDLTDQMLDSLKERPDLRSAINDLQAFGDLDEMPADYREYEMDEMDMIDAMLTGTASRGDLSAGECLMWLDENLSGDWRGLELAWGYEALSRADTTMMRNSDMAEAIIDTIPALRITEPYYDDEIHWEDKNFPEWFRHSTPKATGGSDEARLYRALSNYDDGSPGLSASYTEFRERVLPILQDLDAEAKHELILAERLEPDEYAALDVTQSQHESWIEAEAPAKGDGLSRTESAAEW